jgi:malonyl-CoA/methylmalonyl-CoA synthetase
LRLSSNLDATLKFGGGLLHTGDTGDLVEVDGDMYYRILGRTSVDIIKSGGFKISALRIENVLLEHPDVRAVAVIGLSDDVYGERVVCACELKEGSELAFPELVSWASGLLPVYELPRDMIAVLNLPRNSMGKINKKLVRAMFSETEAGRERL